MIAEDIINNEVLLEDVIWKLLIKYNTTVIHDAIRATFLSAIRAQIFIIKN